MAQDRQNNKDQQDQQTQGQQDAQAAVASASASTTASFAQTCAAAFGRYAAALKARNVKAIVGTVVGAIAVIALALGAVWGVPAIRTHQEDQQALVELRKTPAPAATGSDTGIDWTMLRTRNPEIYAWLTVPGTDVNMPVLQHTGKDDVYYLTHNQWGEDSYIGAAFTEMQNSQSFTDPVTVIYGHDGAAIFKSLHNFEDASFFSEHDTFYVYTPAKHRLTYRIVAAYRSDDSHILNTHDFSQQSVRESYFNQVLHPADSVSHVRDGATIPDDAKVLQLSTCMLNEFHGAHRYIVTGVLEHDDTL